MIVAVAAVLGGCGGDCLPAPASDATPPDVRLTVTYTDAATGRRAERTVTAHDSTVVVEARASGGASVVYAGADSSGMRGLVLSATYRLTVGFGTHREVVETPPVTASCPRAALSGEASFGGGGEPRDLALAAGAQNWAGLRAATAEVVVRFVPEETF